MRTTSGRETITCPAHAGRPDKSRELMEGCLIRAIRLLVLFIAFGWLLLMAGSTAGCLASVFLDLSG